MEALHLTAMALASTPLINSYDVDCGQCHASLQDKKSALKLKEVGPSGDPLPGADWAFSSFGAWWLLTPLPLMGSPALSTATPALASQLTTRISQPNATASLPYPPAPNSSSRLQQTRSTPEPPSASPAQQQQDAQGASPAVPPGTAGVTPPADHTPSIHAIVPTTDVCCLVEACCLAPDASLQPVPDEWAELGTADGSSRAAAVEVGACINMELLAGMLRGPVAVKELVDFSRFGGGEEDKR
jgi:hypothetical protein